MAFYIVISFRIFILPNKYTSYAIWNSRKSRLLLRPMESGSVGWFRLDTVGWIWLLCLQLPHQARRAGSDTTQE